MSMGATSMDVLVSLSKRRGFVFQSSEIYGGTGSCWDYGPLGVELKNNIKRVWWRDFVQQRADMVGIDASILMHPTVWKASGHLDHFTDPMVDCRECKRPRATSSRSPPVRRVATAACDERCVPSAARES